MTPPGNRHCQHAGAGNNADLDHRDAELARCMRGFDYLAGSWRHNKALVSLLRPKITFGLCMCLRGLTALIVISRRIDGLTDGGRGCFFYKNR